MSGPLTEEQVDLLIVGMEMGFAQPSNFYRKLNELVSKLEAQGYATPTAKLQQAVAGQVNLQSQGFFQAPIAQHAGGGNGHYSINLPPAGTGAIKYALPTPPPADIEAPLAEDTKPSTLDNKDLKNGKPWI